jgi:hypothetical protein
MIGKLIQDPVSGHKSLLAAEPLTKGQILCSFSSSEVMENPTRFTLQLSEHRHILLSPQLLWFINHSCAPNIFFDTSAMEVVCLEDIEEGEELCFFYPSTEWSMAEPFNCLCGAPGCLGRSSGAIDLTDEALESHRLTFYVRKKWSERQGIKS